ncbi:MAG: hypothetical protein ACOC0M_00100 [Halomonas sp.]
MAFRVYGMTEHEDRRIAERSTPPQSVDTPQQWEEVVAEKMEKLMAIKRQAPLSAIYDAPQFCEEFIVLARRSGRCRGLHIRRPVKVMAKRRGKPVETTVWKEC